MNSPEDIATIEANHLAGLEKGVADGSIVPILYTNWRGETAVRYILHRGYVPNHEGELRWFIWWGNTDWHPKDQWFLAAVDFEKRARRDFALADIKAWGKEAVEAALATARPDESLERLRALSEAATPGRLRSQGYSNDTDHCVPLIAERFDVPPGGTPTNGMIAMAVLFPSEIPMEGDATEYRRAEADADFIAACWNHVRALLSHISQTAGVAEGHVKRESAEHYLATHAHALRDAIAIARKHAEVSPPDIDDQMYWDHELRALNRAAAPQSEEVE